ncbi:MAG: chromosome segregation protein SMC [Alphaproteobacteria bacterium]|nr:chromosome segregation protein SMC [Alphaproteobacteria bacterium]
MIQFTKLRIHGFKSFADRTEIEIAAGLNGVVGPNGCGKSNLVEALRWVMGENSAKRMRGDGMEDVIFNGTAKRTNRNLAEVSLVLDNTTRKAPAAWNGSDEIEIIRRIERDRGSSYKINGRTVRARDVQMLFADTVTGANSPALVSQGRITQIINSKPQDRRLILEESAGISGLYVRRHEAELRLKAADANLLRIEDILGSMEDRLGALKRQARQAARYRNLSAQIRQMEILVSWLEWSALEERMKVTRTAFETAESQVAERLGAVTQLTKTQTTQALDLPQLRQKEAELAAALQTKKLALQRLDDETARIGQAIQETRSQLAQSENDHTHEAQSLRENVETLERMEQENVKILNEQKTEEGGFEEKDIARGALEQKVLILEERFTALMQGAAETRARKTALEQRLQSNTTRRRTLEERRDTAQKQKDALLEQPTAPVADFENNIRTLVEQAEQTQGASQQTQAALERLAQEIDSARTSLNALENSKSEFNTELGMLENFLNATSGESFPPVLSAMSPDKGFEKALSRALGDSLMASLDEKATAVWLERGPAQAALPALPDKIKPLLPHVKAPKALHAALSQIGIVETEEFGEKMYKALLPGQALVSKNGTYWRWDGFTIKANAPDRHAQTLERQNRLKELVKKRPQIEALVDQARKTLEKKLIEQEKTQNALKSFNAQKQTIESDLTKMRMDWSTHREAQARTESEKNRLEDILTLAQDDLAELEKLILVDQNALEAYDQDSQADKDAQLEQLKETLSEARAAHTEAVRACDQFLQRRNTRNARLHAIADERLNLQNRTIRARERIKQMEERKNTLAEKLAAMLAQPADFEADKTVLLDQISAAEKHRAEAAEKLNATENAVEESSKALREAESRLGESREARAHAQAMFSSLQEQQHAMAQAITEKFDTPPQELSAHLALDTKTTSEPLDITKQKKEKLIKERDAIGPVNLRADDEAQALEKEVTTLLNERNDLIQAIEELRGAIQKINKEARERLLTAFEHVNAHFQNLFMRLFGGGQAYLALIDSEDVLGAGLEIFAQPPGKSLQSLSLLSGGEQTMASIALIFAMFLTNPSPICVLDEIDAPLDDANVDRVCTLLEEIAARGETRFMVITHHRLTMARMDRLYGVTMAEKGISQLVSVDLQQSFNFIGEAA